MKKLFSLFAALLCASVMTFAGSYTITFKDSGSDSDSGSKVTEISDIISSGADYVSAVSATNVYNACTGRGIKLGISSKTGSLTLTLKNATTVKSIVVSARAYNDSEKTLKIQDKSDYTLTTSVEDYTYTYSEATSISSIELASTSKRNYLVSVTVNFESSEPSLSANVAEIDFGTKNIYYDEQKTGSSTFKVTGENLSSNILLAVEGTNASNFSLSTLSLDKDASAEEVTVSYSVSAVGDYSANIKLTGDDQEVVIPITLSAINVEPVTYTKVTNASSLKAGDKLIIVAEGNKRAAGFIGSGKIMGYVSLLNIADGEADITTEEVNVFTLGGATGAWTLTSSEGQLTSTTEKELIADGEGTWTIAIDEEGNAEIRCSVGYIKYNSSSPRFTTYASGQTSVQLYSIPATAAATYDVTPELNPNGTITATPNADVEEGTTVTLTATPNDGYEFEENSWVVKRVDNNEEVAVSNNQFIMPASNVTVAATFNLIPDTEPWCEKATGHLNNADFGDPTGRILLTIEKVEGTNNLKVSVKNNNENGNTKTGLNYLWVNAVDATNNNATYGSHETEDTEEVSVIVEFSEAKDTYTFNNIHWAYSGWDGEWAIDGLTVQASELCEQATPIIPETYELTFSEGQLEYDTDYNQWYYELSEYDENDNFKSAFILWADGEANVRPTSVTDINTIDAEYSYFIVVKAPGDTLLSYENGSLADINISMSYSEEQQLEQQGQIYTYIIMTISGQATDEAGNTYIINESQVIMILGVQAAPLSLAEFIEAAPTEAVELKDLTVIFASGKNTYVIDEEGTALVMYDANKTYYDGTLTAGKVLSGQQATYTIYNNQDEIIPANTVAATDGVAPVPTLLNAQPTTEQVNKYVRLEGVEAVANGNFYYAYDGDLQLYGATGSLKPSKDGIYNLEGIIINFKETQLEIIVTAIEEVPATSIDGINNAKSVRKLIENNQVIILRDGKRYNVIGTEVK